MSNEDFNFNNPYPNQYSYNNSRNFANNQQLASNQNFCDRKRKSSTNNQCGSYYKTNKFFKSTGQKKNEEKEFNVKEYYDKSMIEDPWENLENKTLLFGKV